MRGPESYAEPISYLANHLRQVSFHVDLTKSEQLHDVPSTHDNLERLLHRFREPDSPTLTTVRSIVERLSTELAFQRGDYPSALEHIANAVGSFFDSDEYLQPSFFPTPGGWWVPEWVDRVEELAKGNVAHLRESRGGDVDRPTVNTCCERLKTLYSDDRWPVVNHPPQIAHEGTGFWDETIGWLHTQLPPDQLRDLYEERIRRAAESRPSRYIFPDGIWTNLSEKARDELITADSTWMADWLENRLATILNPVQRATEDMLYHLFSVPIMHWARGRDEEYGWLSSLLGNRTFPGLTDYMRVLSSPTGMTYFLVQPGDQGRVATGLLHLLVAEHAGGSRSQGFLPGLNLAGMDLWCLDLVTARQWATSPPPSPPPRPTSP